MCGVDSENVFHGSDSRFPKAAERCAGDETAILLWILIENYRFRRSYTAYRDPAAN